jgi:multicomponent Na+:H+ antiporter subunit B
MKQFISIVLVLLVGFFIFSALYFPNQADKGFNEYGEVDLDERVSSSYIAKNVTGENDEVVFGESANLEDGSANYVTSVVVNYRSFDTLGEVTVLFISAFGVGLLLSGRRKKQAFAHQPNFILKNGARLVFGIMVIFGVYMFSHGHLTPGGGFPGGAIIAAALLLLYLADNDFRAKMKAFKTTEGVAGSIYVILGLLAIVIGGYFLMNFLPTGIVGTIFSAGLIPIIYVLIGLKVGSEIAGIVDSFLTVEVEK